MTITRAEGQRLAAEAKRIYENPKLNDTQKARHLGAIQSRIEAGTASPALPDYRFLAESGEGDSGISGGPANGFGAKVGAAPALRLADDQMKALHFAAESRGSLGVKVVGATGVDPANYAYQLLPPVAYAREPQRVADLLPAVAVDRGAVEYYVTTGTAGAAVVAEGAVKPTSSITYARRTATAVKLAHWTSATEEAINDYPAFVNLLSVDMVNGIIDAENSELLNGSGTGGHMTGMLATSGILTRPQGTDTALDAVQKAIADLRAGSRYAEPDGMVMSPATYSKLVLAKDANNRYLAGNPTEAGSLDLWGTKVVVTTTAPANVVLVGSFQTATTLFVRSGIEVRTSSGGDSFRSNLLDVVAEERIALAVVLRPHWRK